MIYNSMKHLKNFKSLFEFDSTTETTNDIFDLWKRYRIVGPSYVSGIRDSEWELQDVIDNHGYSKEWSAIYIDENDLEWGANLSVSTGNDEIEQVDYVEMPLEVYNTIKKVFFESLKSLGCEFKTESAVDEKGRKSEFILTEDEIDDFVNKIPIAPKPSDFYIKFEFELFGPTNSNVNRIFVYQLREGSNSEDNYLVTRRD